MTRLGQATQEHLFQHINDIRGVTLVIKKKKYHLKFELCPSVVTSTYSCALALYSWSMSIHHVACS